MHIIARVISADEHLSDMLVTLRGALRIEPAPNAVFWPVAEAGRRVAAALDVSPETGLLELATRELDTAMPPAAAYWRDFARRYLTRLCHTPGLATAREIAPVPLPDETERAALSEAVPPPKRHAVPKTRGVAPAPTPPKCQAVAPKPAKPPMPRPNQKTKSTPKTTAKPPRKAPVEKTVIV